MKKVLLAVLLVFSVDAQAKTAQELLTACTSSNQFLKGLCLGYIEGAVENGQIDPIHPVLGPFDNKDEMRARFTGNYSLDQMKDAFLVFVRDHPEQESHSAPSSLFAAWIDHQMIRLARRGEP